MPNALPTPKGPRFVVRRGVARYGPRDEITGTDYHVVGYACTKGFASVLAAREVDAGGDHYDYFVDIRDRRPKEDDNHNNGLLEWSPERPEIFPGRAAWVAELAADPEDADIPAYHVEDYLDDNLPDPDHLGWDDDLPF